MARPRSRKQKHPDDHLVGSSAAAAPTGPSSTSATVKPSQDPVLDPGSKLVYSKDGTKVLAVKRTAKQQQLSHQQTQSTQQPSQQNVHQLTQQQQQQHAHHYLHNQQHHHLHHHHHGHHHGHHFHTATHGRPHSPNSSSAPSLSSSPDVSALGVQQGLSFTPYFSDEEDDIQFVAGETVNFEYVDPRPVSRNATSSFPSGFKCSSSRSTSPSNASVTPVASATATAGEVATKPVLNSQQQQQPQQPQQQQQPSNTKPAYVQSLILEQKAAIEEIINAEKSRGVPTFPLPPPPIPSFSTEKLTFQEFLQSKEVAKIHDTAKKFAQLRLQQLQNENSLSEEQRAQVECFLEHQHLLPISTSSSLSLDQLQLANEQYAANVNAISSLATVAAAAALHQFKTKDVLDLLNDSPDANKVANGSSQKDACQDMNGDGSYPNGTQQQLQQQFQQQQLQMQQQLQQQKYQQQYQQQLHLQQQQQQQQSSSTSSKRFESDKIWDTSSAEEKERVRQFWKSLSYEERRELVKIPKQTVMQEMREQKRKDCNCHMCGKKRLAIEELESLYDAYNEIEQYSGVRNRIEEVDEEGDSAGDYDDRGPDKDMFNFGNTLSIQGGILRVADDLLKNDGKKFIDMMAHLKEKQQRTERDSLDSMTEYPPSQDEDDIGEFTDDDGKYEDDLEDYEEGACDEEYEDGTDTEEARWAESKQLLQEFAIKIVEQRLMNAYREKVAKERQEKLLEELAEEERVNEEREAKKVRDKERKKERKKQQRQAKEEERMRKQAEMEREVALAKERQRQKAEELRKKKAEQKLKKEAERKRFEEERQRKIEEERRKEQEKKEQEERERQEREEKLLKDKKEREERLLKEKQEREAKEKAEREAKEKAEQERLELERIEKEEREREEQKQREERERELREQEERAARLKQEHQQQLLQSLKQHAEELGAPTAVTVAATSPPIATAGSVDLSARHGSVPSPGTYAPPMQYSQYPQQMPVPETGFFPIQQQQQPQPQPQPDIPQFSQVTPAGWSAGVMPSPQNFAGNMYYNNPLSPVLQTNSIMGVPPVAMGATPLSSTSPNGILPTVSSPGLNNVNIQQPLSTSAIVEGISSYTPIQRPHSNSSSNIGRIVPNRSFNNVENLTPRFNSEPNTAAAGLNTSAISESPAARSFIGTPQPRSRTSSLFAPNTSGGFFGDAANGSNNSSAIESGWSLTGAQPVKPASRRGSMWATSANGTSLWGSSDQPTSVSPPLSASTGTALPSSLLDKRPETSAVSSSFIIQAAITAYQEHARAYTNLSDGKVSAQLLYMTAITHIPGPRINLQEFFNACEKPDDAGIVHFDLIRNHLGLVTHIRLRPQSSSTPITPAGSSISQQHVQQQQQPQPQQAQQQPSIPPSPMGQMYGSVIGSVNSLPPQPALQQGFMMDQHHLFLQQQHHHYMGSGSLTGSVLTNGNGPTANIGASAANGFSNTAAVGTAGNSLGLGGLKYEF